MANKPTEALREPGTTTFQGPVVNDANYQRSGSRVPPGNILRLGPRVSYEDVDEAKLVGEKKAVEPEKDDETE